MTDVPGVGIIGLGFMGRTHLGAFEKAAADGFANHLVAVCDEDADRRAGKVTAGGNLSVASEGDQDLLFDPGKVKAYEKPEDLFADPDVTLVSICTPTETHVTLAAAALEAGKHVLLEKPVALTSAEVNRLVDIANESDTHCMPAMCMRFWPAWSWLREKITDGSLGAVQSAVFRRLGTRPGWAPFYSDPARTGGALLDLHIHDADFVRYCFGPPDLVTATGSLDHVTALYRYDNGPEHVVAEGAWNHSPGFPFRMRYTVIFEQGTADFDLGRDPELLLAEGGEWHAVDVGQGDGYDGEVRHFLSVIAGDTELTATLEEARDLAVMLEAERAALDS